MKLNQGRAALGLVLTLAWGTSARPQETILRLGLGSVTETPAESLSLPEDGLNGMRRSRFRAALFSRNDVQANNRESAVPALVSTNRMGLRYRLTDQSNIGLMQEVQYLHLSQPRAGIYQMRDTYLQYINNRVATLPGDWILIVRYKQFFPSGEFSRLSGRKGAEALGLFENRRMGHFEIECQHQVNYFNQSQASYANKRGKVVATDDHEIDNFLQTAYFFTERFQLWHVVGLELDWEHAAPKKSALRHTNLHNETGFSYQAMRHVLVSLSYSNDPEFEPDNSIRVYNDADSVYRAVFDVKI